MRVQLLYFHTLKQACGCASESIDLPDSATLADAVAAAERLHPALAPFRESLLLARNRRHAQPAEPLADGDEVALMPPVSGG
jgi:molybdopterin synthase catalytic subunit